MKNLTTILLFFCVNLLLAQGEATNWYFGNRAGVNFSSGTPNALLDGALVTDEGCSTISNSSGQLLFYTDGVTVWDRNHTVMPNGTGLLGDSSSTQSAIIVPKPDTTNIFYVFTVASETGIDGLHYSEVDMTLNSGFGDVTSVKNEFLVDETTEKISAVEHANGTDFWVVIHKSNSAEFLSYTVTSTGVNPSPVSSVVGAVHNFNAGYLKISPNGEKLALAKSFLPSFAELFDFNTNTGQVSNVVDLSGNFFQFSRGPYGIEFSTDSNRLYVADVNSATDISKIHQFDLSSNNPTDVLNSRFEIYEGPGIIGALQLAIDGKIYAANLNQSFLSAIENPDGLGAAVNYTVNAVDLLGRDGLFGLPPFVQSFFDIGILFNGSCIGDATAFSINTGRTINSISWDFGDGATSALENPNHIYQNPGLYTVDVTLQIGIETFSLSREVEIFDFPIANSPSDFAICDDETNDGIATFDLTQRNAQILNGQAGSFQVTYHFSQDDALANVNSLVTDYDNVTSPQTIYARLTNPASEDCFDITSFDLLVLPFPEVESEETVYLCSDESITLEVAQGFDSYMWSTGAVTNSIEVDQTGTYSVDVANINVIDGEIISCSTTKTFTVLESGVATITDIETVDWSPNNNSITVFADGLGDYEYSLDGISYQDSNTFSGLRPGDFVIYVRDKNDCGVTIEEVTLLYYARYFTPNGDVYNAHWTINFSNDEPDIEIFIYDRFGKLIKQLDPSSLGWDGTFNGNKMPSDDYWFVVNRPSNGRTYRGHFTLKR